MSKYCVIGRHGLIGSALAKRLGEVDSFPTKETKVLFHFGSYSHKDFERNPHYLMSRTLQEWSELLPLCYEQGAIFVYPSSALVYESDTQFSLFKTALEQLAKCYKTVTLGLRIFPVYGPGESRSVISKWCREMKAGQRPVVYGDGTQARDFIYIHDVVEQIVSLVEKPFWNSQIVDIGTGVKTDFNSIVALINAVLGTDLEPQYVNAPWEYSEGIACSKPLPNAITVAQGILRMFGHIPSGKLNAASGATAPTPGVGISA